jgi:hypothetical protein
MLPPACCTANVARKLPLRHCELVVTRVGKRLIVCFVITVCLPRCLKFERQGAPTPAQVEANRGEITAFAFFLERRFPRENHRNATWLLHHHSLRISDHRRSLSLAEARRSLDGAHKPSRFSGWRAERAQGRPGPTSRAFRELLKRDDSAKGRTLIPWTHAPFDGMED